MDLNRVTFVTAHFNQLQGLRLVPFGAFLLILAVMSFGWLDWLPGRPPAAPTSWGNAWLPALFAAAVIAAIACGDYYRNRYGAVEQVSRSRRNAGITTAMLLFVSALGLDLAMRLPVLLSGLVLSVALGGTAWVDGQFRRHYAVAAGLWIVVSLLPTMGMSGDVLPAVMYGGGGATLIICGVGDHYGLTKTMLQNE